MFLSMTFLKVSILNCAEMAERMENRETVEVAAVVEEAFQV